MHRVAFSAGRSVNAASKISSSRTFASVSSATRNHKVVVVGGGSAGLAISHQLLRTGKFTQDDIAIVDPAAYHDYQPGWTLVGGGLKTKEELRKPMSSLVDSKLKLYNQGVNTFAPEENLVTLSNGDKVGYENLVVAPGIGIKYDNIKGLPEALADQSTPVSTIYGYETCDKVFRNIKDFRGGEALFTLPTGVVKCAGAPQKAMWLALDHWKKAGLYDPSNVANSPIKISFATALPVMFGVPKYSATLEELRKQRGVEAMFQHDLVEVNGDKAIFTRLDGSEEKVSKRFDLLHVVPKMGPHAFIKDSPLANAAGFVDVEDATLRHKKFANVWSAGDASSLPTAKTAAAVTSQAPVLVQNMLQSIEGKELNAAYDGYTSCPLLTEYGKVLLAEFKYGGQPKETFAKFGVDQAVPRRAFYHLKKDFFPWVYYNNMVKGTWGGPKGWRPGTEYENLSSRLDVTRGTNEAQVGDLSMRLNVEKAMESQDQNSLDSEHGISLLHEKILQLCSVAANSDVQENNHFALTQPSQTPNHAPDVHSRPRHFTPHSMASLFRSTSTATPSQCPRNSTRTSPAVLEQRTTLNSMMKPPQTPNKRRRR
ncbi:sulfide,quinone oxidoreductase/flavo-binding protein, partial [Aureobasidium melanogenum]